MENIFLEENAMQKWKKQYIGSQNVINKRV